MQAVSHLVKESLPNYLKDLPIPDSILGKNLCCGSVYGIWNLSDPGSGIEKFGSGINIQNPQH
jgi:hypothetical protein